MLTGFPLQGCRGIGPESMVRCTLERSPVDQRVKNISLSLSVENGTNAILAGKTEKAETNLD